MPGKPLTVEESIQYYDLMRNYASALSNKQRLDYELQDETTVKGDPRDRASKAALSTGIAAREFAKSHAGPDGKMQLPNIENDRGTGPAVVSNTGNRFTLVLDGRQAPSPDEILKTEGLRDPVLGAGALRDVRPRTPVSTIPKDDPQNQHACGNVRNTGQGASTTIGGQICR